MLTYAGRKLAGPLVVLKADPHGRANEPEAGQTLVDDGVAVAEVLADHLAVHDALWDPTVAGWVTDSVMGNVNIFPIMTGRTKKNYAKN